jgi:hypothetical protein
MASRGYVDFNCDYRCAFAGASFSLRYCQGVDQDPYSFFSCGHSFVCLDSCTSYFQHLSRLDAHCCHPATAYCSCFVVKSRWID